MNNLSDYVKSWQQESDYSWNSFWLMFGSFLDYFYKIKDLNILKDEPNYDNNVSSEIKSFVAASVDYLCNDNNTPDWVKEKKYILKDPFFPSNVTGSIKVIMLIESPIEFKSRNIYVTSSVLSRL